MLVAILADSHFNVRNGSIQFQTYFEKFITNHIIPTLDKMNIKKIIHLGDFTDNRKYVNTQIMSRIRETFIEPIVAREIETDFILGNHDVYLKNTNKISSPNEFLRTYPKFRIFDETTHIKIDNLDCLYIPWINSENQEKSLNTIKNSYASVVFGHLELQSFLMYPGVYCEHGLDKTLFKKFKQVWSGHFHTSSFKIIFFIVVIFGN